MSDEILSRIQSEVDAQDGTDVDAPDLTSTEWAKVKATTGAGFGSRVTIKWRGELSGIYDHGYLTCVPGQHDDWDLIGIVHIPRPWVEKERPIPEWHSLYALCRNKLVEAIVIGEPR